MIEVDVETTGVQWYAHDLFLVTFKEPGHDPVILRHPEDRILIRQYLSGGPEAEFRAWNSKFDMHFLRAAGYELHGRWHDGMVQAHLVNAERSLALKAVAEDMFGDEARFEEKELKTWLNKEAATRRKRSKESGEKFIAPNYSDVPDELMLPYAAQDVLLTENVCSQLDLVTDDELRELYDLEMDVLQATYAMEVRGVPVDEEAARWLEMELIRNVEAWEMDAVKLAGKSNFNCNSSQQIHEALKRRGADLRFCTKTKNGVSMDAESLRTVDDPLAEAILKFRSENKVLSTYIHPMLHESWTPSLRCMKAPFIQDGRIHPDIKQVGARNGRMACADPNMQNWPRDDLRLRYLIKARPGYKLVTCDLDSIELRLFAAYAGGEFKESFLRGEDQHSRTAALVGLQDKRRSSGAIESARQRGKTFNYAMIYGAGVRSLRKAFEVSQEEARLMLNRFRAAYPEILELQHNVEWKLQHRGYVKTAWGRRQRIPAREAYKGVNYMISGTAAEILKVAAVRLHKSGVPLVLPVHDELIAEVPERDAQRTAEMLEDALTLHPRITKKIPLVAEAAIVDRWSQAKDPDYVPDFIR